MFISWIYLTYYVLYICRTVHHKQLTLYYLRATPFIYIFICMYVCIYMLFKFHPYYYICSLFNLVGAVKYEIKKLQLTAVLCYIGCHSLMNAGKDHYLQIRKDVNILNNGIQFIEYSVILIHYTKNILILSEI